MNKVTCGILQALIAAFTVSGEVLFLPKTSRPNP